MSEQDEQCRHWNTMLPGGIPLRPIRCLLTPGHAGRHQCGDTAWSSDLGEYRPTEGAGA